MRSPFLAVVPPAAALAAGLTRWALQGSGNLYTATARRAYVPDPDLGWRVVDGGPIWLGLEILAVILAVACVVAVGAALVRRRERDGRARRGLRGALWAIGAVPLVVPLAAFATGFGPAGARDTLPATATTGAPQDGVTGALDAPAGRWDVIVHPGSAITARVSAGGEAFDARLAGGIAGTWTGDPHDLRAPMAATVGVDAASVDTGIAMRSKSARDDYLRAAEFPRLEFTLDRLIAARPDGDRRVAFRAAGTLAMIGGRVAVEVTGTLTVLDDAARARLDLDPAAPAMLAVADLSVPIAATALADDAGDLDGDHLPIHVQLVLVHRATPTAPESP